MLHPFKRIHCTVCVDGENLEEYNSETKGNDVRCYIAAEEGKEYVVKVRNEAYVLCDDNTLVAELYVDGSTKLIASTIHFNRDTPLEGKRDAWGNVQPLFFRRLTTKPGGSFRAAKLPDLSTITVVVKQVEIIAETPPHEQFPDRFKHRYESFETDSGESEDVDERSVKQNKVLRDRITRFGHAMPDIPGTFIKTRPLRKKVDSTSTNFACDDEHSTDEYVRFTFQYRSRELLEASGIIPLPEIAPAADHEKLLQDVKQEGHHSLPRRNLRDRIKKKGQPAEETPELPSDMAVDHHNFESEEEDSPIVCRKRARPVLDNAFDRSQSGSDEDAKLDTTASSHPTRKRGKTRKMKPTPPREEGVMIDLAAEDGPVETRFPFEKKEVEVVDLHEDGDDNDGGVSREHEDCADQVEEGFIMDEGGFIVRGVN
ncbi:hypothetical protein HK097_001153 [Rhizophlyctis rosea]|uniref:DUF7918 domain-containing protein n=1 Tax=Rhizophlyctis rosea TaxID=64517 RepID=A0AAD5SHT0_9FUNG|nr:hypothetical protein HK097_001153 [Rhizophlyctis rosea]